MIPLGQEELNCSHKGTNYQLLFQIVDVEQRPLLSAETCGHMGFLTVNMGETVHMVNTSIDQSSQPASEPLTREQILKDYADVFHGLGCLPGTYHLEVDKTTKPVQHYPRKVAVALKPELKKTIEELVKRKVLASVAEPTECISSMVVAKKPTGKLRISLDPKDLNKALKLSHYPMPTIEDILPSLTKAKVFSVLDAKDGFWQVKPKDDSMRC